MPNAVMKSGRRKTEIIPLDFVIGLLVTSEGTAVVRAGDGMRLLQMEEHGAKQYMEAARDRAFQKPGSGRSAFHSYSFLNSY